MNLDFLKPIGRFFSRGTPTPPASASFSEIVKGVKKADREVMTNLITCVGGLETPEQKRRFDQYLSFYRGNPDEFLMPFCAKRSTAAAYQIFFGQSIRYYDWIDESVRRVPPLGSAISTAGSQILSKEMIWRSEDEESKQGVMIKEWCEENLGPFVHTYLPEALECGISHGFAMHEIVYTIDKNGMDVPTHILHRHPSLFVFGEMGEPFLYGSDFAPAPAIKFFRFTVPAKYSSGYGRSLVFELADEIQHYKDARVQLARLLNRFGMPIVLATLEFDSDQDYRTRSAATVSAVEQLAGSVGMVVPEGVTLDFKDRGAREASVPHFESLNFSSKLIVTKILGATLGVMESEYGTRAQADVHSETSRERTMFLEKLVVQAWNEGVARIVERNFGKDAPKAYLDVDFDANDDADNIRRIINDAIKAGIPLQEAEVYKALGLKVPATEAERLKLDPPANYAPSVLASPYNPLLGGGPKLGYQGDGGFSESEKKAVTFTEIPDAAKIAAQYQTTALALADIPLENPENLNRFLTEVRKVCKGAAASQGKTVPTMDYEPPIDVLRSVQGAALLAIAQGIDQFAPLLATEKKAAKKPVKMSEKATRADLQRRFHRTVNMKPAEIDRHRKQTFEESRVASLETLSACQALATKPDKDWTPEDERKARSLVAFIERASAIPAPKKSRVLDLRNWGHDAARTKGAASQANPFLSRNGILSFAKGVATFADDPFEDMPEEFEPAARWMLDREIATPEQVRELARKLSETSPERTIAQWERVVRERMFALKSAVDATVTAAVQEQVADAVRMGTPWSEWIQDMDKKIDAGGFRNADDAYLETVYRTETANAYSAQQREFESDPAVDDFLWGWETFNARLELSRPSHMALDGKFWRKGSAASELLGWPPYSYNCTCIRSPLIDADPANAPYQESGDAMELAENLVRFSECGCDGCDGERVIIAFPEDVDRVAKALIDDGHDEDSAWAIAWAKHKKEQRADMAEPTPRSIRGNRFSVNWKHIPTGNEGGFRGTQFDTVEAAIKRGYEMIPVGDNLSDWELIVSKSGGEVFRKSFDGGTKELAQPTPAQIKAGNYSKKHLRFEGLDISIETPAGAMRRGVSIDGNAWERLMTVDYGYIRRTVGRDNEHIDVMIKPDAVPGKPVYIVNQVDEHGDFDEHKCMIGFDLEDEARAAYLEQYAPGWKCGIIVRLPMSDFREWVKTGDTRRPMLKTKREESANRNEPDAS